MTFGRIQLPLLTIQEPRAEGVCEEDQPRRQSVKSNLEISNITGVKSSH